MAVHMRILNELSVNARIIKDMAKVQVQDGALVGAAAGMSDAELEMQLAGSAQIGGGAASSAGAK